MPDGSIPYASLVETALMGVVRDVLDEASRTGLEPPHHFYVTFRTDHPGVDMPAELRQRYQPEMTIVLQHQFWDLDVGEDRFAVTLAFGGRHHRLSVPFAAVKVFADPGVEFGLQFTLADREADEAGLAPGGRPALAAVPDPVEEDPAPAEPDGKAGADIVTLDQFRKR